MSLARPESVIRSLLRGQKLNGDGTGRLQKIEKAKNIKSRNNVTNRRLSQSIWTSQGKFRREPVWRWVRTVHTNLHM